MQIIIHTTDHATPITVDVADDAALRLALSDRYATFPTATGRVMVNRDHIVSIDLPPATQAGPAA